MSDLRADLDNLNLVIDFAPWMATWSKGYRERGRPPGNPVNLAMLVIPAKMKPHLKTFLDASGINDRSVYPDMAGYANSFPPA